MFVFVSFLWELEQRPKSKVQRPKSIYLLTEETTTIYLSVHPYQPGKKGVAYLAMKDIAAYSTNRSCTAIWGRVEVIQHALSTRRMNLDDHIIKYSDRSPYKVGKVRVCSLSMKVGMVLTIGAVSDPTSMLSRYPFRVTVFSIP